MPLAGLLHDGGFGPVGTTVAGSGYINKRLCIVNANLSTRKAGTVDYATSLKIRRLGEIALENKIPTINLVESGGANLPDQDRVFNNYGATFREMSLRSKQGIPLSQSSLAMPRLVVLMCLACRTIPLCKKMLPRCFWRGHHWSRWRPMKIPMPKNSVVQPCIATFRALPIFWQTTKWTINIARNLVKTLKPHTPISNRQNPSCPHATSKMSCWASFLPIWKNPSMSVRSLHVL